MSAPSFPERAPVHPEAVLAASPTVHLAVRDASGIHVTPELATWRHGRLWTFTMRRTVKARAVAADGRVAVLGRHGASVAMARGRAVLLDPTRPVAAARHWRDLLPAADVSAAYGARHLPDLVGFVSQLLSGQLDRSALRPRALLVVRVDAAAVLRGPDVLAQSGAWSGAGVAPPDHAQAADPGSVELDDVPDRPAELAGSPRRCVVGWPTPEGPLAVPGWWEPDAAQARVPAAAWRLAALPTLAEATVEVEHDDAPGPVGKRGLMVRGRATVTFQGAWAVVSMDADRVTWWDGVATGTVRR